MQTNSFFWSWPCDPPSLLKQLCQVFKKPSTERTGHHSQATLALFQLFYLLGLPLALLFQMFTSPFQSLAQCTFLQAYNVYRMSCSDVHGIVSSLTDSFQTQFPAPSSSLRVLAAFSSSVSSCSSKCPRPQNHEQAMSASQTSSILPSSTFGPLQAPGCFRLDLNQ